MFALKFHVATILPLTFASRSGREGCLFLRFPVEECDTGKTMRCLVHRWNPPLHRTRDFLLYFDSERALDLIGSDRRRNYQYRNQNAAFQVDKSGSHI